MNEEHPAESRQEWVSGVVTRVHPESWEVDVRLIYGSSAEVRRCKVLGPFLPELDVDSRGQMLPNRQGRVLVGFVDAYGQRPVAIPIHNVIIPDAEKAAHVYWSEHLNARITINRENELEVRIKDGEKLYQIQIQERDGIIRAKTPTMSVEPNDASKSIIAKCQGDATIDAKGNVAVKAGNDVEVTAGGGIKAQAGSDIELQAVNVKITGQVQITGDVAVTGNVNAVGSIIDAAGNTPHHSHS